VVLGGKIKKIIMKRFKNYMFFENLEQLSRDIDKLMTLDKNVIDELLCNGHDWAGEHITTAKDDIEEITNFLLSNVDSKPYSEEINEVGLVRTFSKDIDSNELEWHRDKEDRIIIPISENDWTIQYDGELPLRLSINEEFFIPKNSFHRVIKGSTDLVVEVIKTTFEEDEYELVDTYETYEIIEEGKKKKKKKKKKAKRDACYYKVKGRYDVWPSAYASGALTKCRKVGAANWGNKTDESKLDEAEIDYEKEKTWRIQDKFPIEVTVKKGWSGNYYTIEPKPMDISYDTFMDLGSNKGVSYTSYDYTTGEAQWTSDSLKQIKQWEEDNQDKIKVIYPNNLNESKMPTQYGVLKDEIKVGVREVLQEAKKKKIKKRKLTSKPSSESNLGDWFKRKGAKGKTGGWVDCNAPDGDGGYKSCGRKEGEKRDKYPACRPTKAACKSKGKGKKWGKKSKKNENFDYSEKNAIFEETFNMEELELHNPGEKTAPNPVRESPVIPTEKPSPRRKKIWETKPAAKPKPKMEQ